MVTLALLFKPSTTPLEISFCARKLMMGSTDLRCRRFEFDSTVIMSARDRGVWTPREKRSGPVFCAHLYATKFRVAARLVRKDTNGNRAVLLF